MILEFGSRSVLQERVCGRLRNGRVRRSSSTLGDEVDGCSARVRGPRCRRTAVLLTHAHIRPHHWRLPPIRRHCAFPSTSTETICFLRDGCPAGAMFEFKVRQPPPVMSSMALSRSPSEDYARMCTTRPAIALAGLCLAIGKTDRRDRGSGTGSGFSLFCRRPRCLPADGRTDCGRRLQRAAAVDPRGALSVGDAVDCPSRHGPDTTIGRERTTNPSFRVFEVR